ncbi:hypothetical protein C8J57DRAFT_1161530 [Mycena rebaudengoi]|nr:hypothetical protein C8J57DRAFT_1161530 [Mycena rebaudengoi]
MSYYNKFGAEPFEESQGSEAPSTSPDELQAFYQHMQAKETLERKLSKRNSLWSRKSLKRASSNPKPNGHPPPGPVASSSSSSLVRQPPRSQEDYRPQASDVVPPMPLSRSIIPDPMRELPAWYNEEQGGSKERMGRPLRYNLHNPVGPRWYRNHHLIPPTGRTRPVFSPSFPPMSPSGILERSEDSSRMPNLSRSASNSPLPTPNSSQTGIQDVGPRSRKNSQTAHDNVDLLDVSDPWGTPWHHESPYDVGLTSNNSNPHAAPPAAAPAVARSRTASVTTAQNRRKTVTPSPLSQSTSAVHLQIPNDADPSQLPRKLSKRRTVGIFGKSTVVNTVPDSNSYDGHTAAHRGPGPPSAFVPVATSKKDRRGSVLGRLAKRFSITRKPSVVVDMDVTRQPSPEKPFQLAGEPIKRVPPPQEPNAAFVHLPPENQAPLPTRNTEASKRASSILSLEAELSYTMGRLTVANPDPGSVESTPVQREPSLPPEEGAQEWAEQNGYRHERGATEDSMVMSAASPVQSNSPSLPIFAQRAQSPVDGFQRQPSPELIYERQPSPEKAYERQSSPTNVFPRQPSPEKAYERQPSPTKAPQRQSHYRPASPPAPPIPEKVANSSANSHRSANPPSPPSPDLPAIPFPMDYGSTLAPPPRELEPEIMSADISPMSASSMLVNPPTPYTSDMLMPDDEPAPPPVPSKRSSRDPSPSQVTAVTGRETETFKLIRSSSGNVYASSETIRAAGEQWEVVESLDKGKNRSQDRESENRKEQRRARAERDGDSERVRSERSRKRSSADAPQAGLQQQVFPQSSSSHRRAPIPEALVSRQEDNSRQHKRDQEQRERKSERRTTDPRLDKPQPVPPAPSRRTLERNASKSARPTSEVPTAADMNAIKAREAWDMDRLWKARSMNGMEPNGVTMPPPPVPPPKRPEDLPAAVYGSSHTAFMVSTPFQHHHQQPVQIYHSMPPAPPPVVYPSGYSPTKAYPNTNNRSAPSLEHAASNTSTPASRPPLANPLPEPPRESPYEPVPLSLPWTKHPGVTTAH